LADVVARQVGELESSAGLDDGGPIEGNVGVGGAVEPIEDELIIRLRLGHGKDEEAREKKEAKGESAMFRHSQSIRGFLHNLGAEGAGGEGESIREEILQALLSGPSRDLTAAKRSKVNIFRRWRDQKSALCFCGEMVRVLSHRLIARERKE